MDWDKVIAQLEDEWYNRKQLHEMYPNRDDAKEHKLLSMMASMLADCLRVGR